MGRRAAVVVARDRHELTLARHLRFASARPAGIIGHRHAQRWDIRRVRVVGELPPRKTMLAL